MPIVYFHRNPINKEIFYVGIGNKEKRASIIYKRNKHWDNYVSKYGKPIIEIKHYVETWEEACILEKKYISEFKRSCDGGRLVNITLGGDGNLGYKMTDKNRKLASERLTKFLSDPINKKRHSEVLSISHNKCEFKNKQRVNSLNQFSTIESRIKHSEVLKKSWTKELRLKQSENTKRQFSCTESKERHRQSIVKSHSTIEFRENMSEKKLSTWILNTNTGIYYLGYESAANSIGKNKKYLEHRLIGSVYNNTPFIKA